MLKPIRLVLVGILLTGCSSFGNYKLEVGDEVRTQRGFFDYQAADAEMLSHTIAVGHPGGVSYVYDLETGRLVGTWTGGFIDTRGMWHGRGRGGFTALGEVRFLGKSNPLYGAGTATNEFRGRGYSIEESSGIPRFHYTHGTINVTDMIAPLPGNNGVQHKVNLSQRGNGLTYRLVTADSIARQENGSFLIDGGRFVIGAISGGTVNIRDSGTSLELAVEESDLSYTVSW